MNRTQDPTKNREPMVSSKRIDCAICMDKTNRNSRIAITLCNCRFHENCIVDWLKRQEDKNIFTRSCFNSCPLAVPLHIENSALCADSEKCNVNQANDRIEKPQPFYENPALTACRTGNLELLKCEYNKHNSIMREHFISAVDNKSYSLIFMAVKEGHLEIVKFLSTLNRCPINFPNGIDSALHVAVQNAHLEIVKHLLPDSNTKSLNAENKTPFEIALDNNYMDIIKALRENTSIALTPDNSNTILHKLNNALSVNDTEMVLCMLSIITLDDEIICNMIKHCIIKSNIKILEVLINRISKEHINSFELLRTAFDGSVNDDMIIWLIHNIDYSMLSDRGKSTLLLYAIRTNSKICYEIFTSLAFKDTFSKEPLKQDIFTLFIENNDMDNMQLLINKGVDFTFKTLSDDHKENIIYHLTKKKAFDSTECLIAIAPSLNKTGIFHRFFLRAIKENDLDMVKWLVDNEVDFNTIDDYSGMTYLSCSLQHKHFDVTKYLIEKNADVNLIDRDTMTTPLHNAIDIGNDDIIKLLINKGASIVSMDKNGRTPLNHATDSGNTCIIELLNEKHQGYQKIKESIVTDLHSMKIICIDNDTEYSNEEPDTEIKKFENAITLLEHLDVTKITRGEKKSDYDILTDGYSFSQFDVYYEEKLLCTLFERETYQRFETSSLLGWMSGITTSDLFNELFDTLGTPQ